MENTGKIRILIVDDRYMQVQAWAEVMVGTGRYEVTTAFDGQQGLEKLCDNPVDIVLTDNNMPVMDGPTFVKEGKRLYPKLPFIIIAAEPFDVSLASIAQECGADAYLPKPVDFKDLEEKIQALVER